MDDEKKQALRNCLTLWLNWHMSETIGALVNLEIPEGVEPKEDAVSKIAAKVYEEMGIVAREDLEEVIAELTPETRAELRTKKIRLGPILIFIPELNKPAAVRLRALLWSLFNGRPLPAQVPADGIVSAEIADEGADPVYYRAIGYPLYGGRAVRIDMLDRVISCIYDHASEGKFQARHEMAEWLGSSIEGLYKVLEAMGHKKIHDPAEEAAKAEEEAAKAGEDSEKKVEETEEKKDEPTADTEQDSKDKNPAEKPELAVFRLKKGKAFKSKRQSDGRKGKTSFDKKKKGENGKGKAKRKGFKKNKERGPRVITAEAKVNEADNPFAILQQLKK